MTNFSKLMRQQAKMFAPPKQELYLDGRKFGMDYDFTIDDKPNGKEVQFTLYNAFNIQVKEVKLINGGIILFEGYVTNATQEYNDTDIKLIIDCVANNNVLVGLTDVEIINKGTSLNNYFPSNLKDYKVKNVIHLTNVKSNEEKLQKIAKIEKLGIYNVYDGSNQSVIFLEQNDAISSINNIVYFNIKSVADIKNETVPLHLELDLKCLLNPFVYVTQKIEFQGKIYIINKNHIDYKVRAGLIQDIYAYDEKYGSFLLNANLEEGVR